MKFKLKGKPPKPSRRVNVYNFKTVHVVASLALMLNVFILACIAFGNPIAATMVTSAISTTVIFFYFMIRDMFSS